MSFLEIIKDLRPAKFQVAVFQAKVFRCIHCTIHLEGGVSVTLRIFTSSALISICPVARSWFSWPSSLATTVPLTPEPIHFSAHGFFMGRGVDLWIENHLGDALSVRKSMKIRFPRSRLLFTHPIKMISRSISCCLRLPQSCDRFQSQGDQCLSDPVHYSFLKHFL